jgi:hypothetical protein
MRIIIATLALSIAAPAFAAPAEIHHFDRDGSRYQYVQTRKADGSLLLKGEVLDTHDAFELRVANGRVSGTVGASPVSFAVSKQAMAALDAGTPAAAAALAAN